MPLLTLFYEFCEKIGKKVLRSGKSATFLKSGKNATFLKKWQIPWKNRNFYFCKCQFLQKKCVKSGKNATFLKMPGGHAKW